MFFYKDNIENRNRMEATVGSRVEHPRYGEGIVSEVKLNAYEIFFEQGGKLEILKSNADLSIKTEGERSGVKMPTARDIAQAVAMVLDRYEALPGVVELGKKWEGGTMTLTPGTPGLQPKEIPIETFFHKIVMLRDRLRVMEQQINAHKDLSDEEKVNLQQYITRCYGSLTTFNVLFANKEDYFVGAGKE